MGSSLRHRPGGVRALTGRSIPGFFLTGLSLTGLSLTGMTGARAAPVDAAAGAGATITVPLSGLRSARGVIQACMTTRADAFPQCDKDPASLRLTVPVAAKGGTVLVFRHVPPGTYAISLFHDQNANGRLDTMMGIPSEGYGFSRDAAVRFGPPRFAEARFAVGAADLTMPIKVRHIL